MGRLAEGALSLWTSIFDLDGLDLAFLSLQIRKKIIFIVTRSKIN